MDLSLVTKERENVWCIFSDLFLDTALDDLQLLNIAEKVANTSFSIEELVLIMENEVAPSLHTNLLVVGGEWAFFECQKEVIDPIRKRLAVVPDVNRNGWWPFAVLRRKLQMSSITGDWCKVLSHIKKIRDGTESGA